MSAPQRQLDLESHIADLINRETRLGDELLAGIVLYAGGRSLPFGPRLRAMPISALWTL